MLLLERLKIFRKGHASLFWSVHKPTNFDIHAMLAISKAEGCYSRLCACAWKWGLLIKAALLDHSSLPTDWSVMKLTSLYFLYVSAYRNQTCDVCRHFCGTGEQAAIHRLCCKQ